MYLADTHVVLWSIADHPKLKGEHRAILNSDAIVYVSAASVWEIAIKRAIGKLDAPSDLESLLPRMNFVPLDVTARHAWSVAELPFHHRDPFDRILAAQALIENLTLLTVDYAFRRYGISIA